jgi:hypothetical protein
MPTPPPDIDVEKWQSSINLVESWAPTGLGLTHFGAIDDVDGQIEKAREHLTNLAQMARDLDAATFLDRVKAEVHARVGDSATQAAYLQANPPETMYPGLDRYWAKQATDTRSSL